MMQGFINKAIQCFARDMYGDGLWRQVTDSAGLGYSNFEAMLDYPPDVTDRVLQELQSHLGKSRETLCEDLGTYLVSHPHMEALRRLLRFGGASFEEFLQSLDELPDKARLALPEITLPSLSVRMIEPRFYCLRMGHGLPGFSLVMMGILRALADDYGAFVLLELLPGQTTDEIHITLADAEFSSGRSFDLSAGRQVAHG